MKFSPPAAKSSPADKFDPTVAEHEIVLATIKGQALSLGYMDKVDPSAAHVRIQVPTPSSDGKLTFRKVWVSANDIRYRVASLEEGQMALAELQPSSPAKRVWLAGCPYTEPKEEGITPAEHNMAMATEFFGVHQGLACGVFNQAMMDSFAEKLDTYFVRDVSVSINENGKPPGPNTSGSFTKCLEAFLEFWKDFVVTEMSAAEISQTGEEGEVVSARQDAAYHLLYIKGMGHNDKLGQIIPGTEVRSPHVHTVKYVISPGDKSKLIYWKVDVDMEQIKGARKVAADLVAAEKARIKAAQEAARKAEEERLAAEREAARLAEEAKMAAEAEAARIAKEEAEAEELRQKEEAERLKKEAEEEKKRAKEEAKKAKEAEAAAKKAEEEAAAEAAKNPKSKKGKKK